MNPIKSLVLAAMIATVSCFIVGCGSGDEEVEQSQQVVRNIPKPKPRPKAKTTTELQSSLSIDDRIYMDELDSPKDEESRIAVLQFFNAILHTDVSTLQGMLSLSDQIELESMIGAGLDAYMQNISMVLLQTGSSPDGQSCVIAKFEHINVEFDYQVQVWFYQNDSSVYTFESAPTQPNLVDKLSGNWVANYVELLEKQIEIAEQPDAGTSYTLAGEATTTSGGSGPKPPSGPGPRGPGGPSGPGR